MVCLHTAEIAGWLQGLSPESGVLQGAARLGPQARLFSACRWRPGRRGLLPDSTGAPRLHADTRVRASLMSFLAEASHGSGLHRQECWVGLGVCRIEYLSSNPYFTLAPLVEKPSFHFQEFLLNFTLYYKGSKVPHSLSSLCNC